MKKLLWLLGMLSSATTIAHAGANAGGGLVVVNPSLAYTTDESAYCGGSGPSSCDQAVVRIDGSGWWVWKIYAAFPAGDPPELMGVTIGVNYDKADPWNPTVPDYDGLLILDHRMCGDFEIASSNWPDPGTGTGMTWNSPQTSQLVECYWFGGYNYGDLHNGGPSPEVFELIPHPNQGGWFADASVPSELDPIAAYGRLGFDAPGYLPCPEVFRACCNLATGECSLRAQELCLSLSVWHGEWTDLRSEPLSSAGPGSMLQPGHRPVHLHRASVLRGAPHLARGMDRLLSKSLPAASGGRLLFFAIRNLHDDA